MSIIVPPSSSYPTNVFNYSPQNLRNWRKALGKVRSGISNSRVIFIGDSTTLNIDAAGTWTAPGVTANLAALLTASGTPATSDNISGFSVSGATTGSRLGTDPRCVAGSWTAASLATLGGAVLSCGSGTTPFTFTPTANVDTANIFYSPYGSGGSATVQLGSGSTATINETSDAGPLATKTVTATLGANAVKLTYVSGSTVYVEAIETYNSAVKSVNIMNAGWWGSVSSNWNAGATSYNSIPMLKYLAPDLTVITAGINDWVNSVSVATFTANIQALITAAQISGDVILVTPAPNNSNPSIQPNYLSALYQLAAANGCVLIDNYARWVSYTVSSPLGYYEDTIHPTPQGYADQAQMLKNVLLNV